MTRVLKQILYGLFYLVIFSGLTAGVYFAFLRPAASCFDNKLNQNEEEVDCGGPCADCALRRLKPVRVLPVQFFGGDSLTTVLLQFQNPNLNYGADRLDFEARLLDRAGSVIRSIADRTFIYPGEIKTIVLPGVETPFFAVTRGEVSLANISWKKAEEFSRPSVDTREIKTVPEGAGIAITGVVQNKNLFALNRAVISAIISNKNGLLVNASKTFVADLAPREERFFKIFVPVARDEQSDIDPSRTSVYVEVSR